jgi:alkanesulfonate monooxygenase SsuD/methylene tetrahydromethanopterin reductase-like flavin-dependent oxidoreductase (luciferase family)
VRHRGEHFVVDGVTLAPLPVQERVPIWIGGNRTASLRRAARWDGWIADSADPTGLTLSPDDVARRIETIRAARSSADAFDVAVLGEADRMEPRRYEAAGAGWWLENVHDRRGTSEELRRLVEAGPPGSS